MIKNISRRSFIGALILLLLTAACNLPSGETPAPVGTIFPDGQFTATAPATGTLSSSVSPTGIIPVTGSETVSLQCQFCVNDEPHAVLIMPEMATFLVSDPVIGINCLTAQVVNGQRIVLCRGAKQTSFTLNVCVGNSSCLQWPITLEDCPLIPQTGVGTPQIATFPPALLPPSPTPLSLTPTVPTPIDTPMPTLSSANTTTPLPTEALVVPRIQPTRATPGINPQPSQPPATTATNLQDPAAFMRWYFGAVWQERNYEDLWNNYLTESFKTHSSSGSYEDYAKWWSSVARVDVNSVNVLQNEGTHAWVRVNVTFHMNDGRIVANQEYDYDLLYDATRGTWMFDYRL